MKTITLGLFNIGVPEVLLILLIVLLLFGAKRLPELARSLGKSLSEFKKGKEEGSESTPDRLDESAPDKDQKKP